MSDIIPRRPLGRASIKRRVTIHPHASAAQNSSKEIITTQEELSEPPHAPLELHRRGLFRRRTVGEVVPATTNIPQTNLQRQSSTHEARAALLARVYRLPLHEVKRIVEAFESAEKDEDGHMSEDELSRCLSIVFDVEAIDKEVVLSARAALDSKDSADVNRFLGWYVQNMFRQVLSLTGSPDMVSADVLVSRFAKAKGIRDDIAAKIKYEFDRYDTNKNGVIDFHEFQQMLSSILRISAGDLSEQRITRFWKEIDQDGDGGVDFYEFASWYMKYFRPSSDTNESNYSSDLYSKLLSSYMPAAFRTGGAVAGG